MKKKFLINSDYDKYKDRLDRIYKCLAFIAIQYGKKEYSDEQIELAWEYSDTPPTWFYVRKNIKVSIIKWYIHNQITFNKGLWNNDFLHGLIYYGKINWGRRRFPSLEFDRNEEVFKLLQNSPFGGTLKRGSMFRWKQAPALCLDYSTESIEFMAGVMAGFKQVKLKINNKYEHYAQATRKIIPLLNKWEIPFQRRSANSYCVLLSPIWPALLAPWTPSENKWTNLESSIASLYAAIMWRTYVKKNFEFNGIPYLHGRNKIFTMMGEGRGKMRRLEKKRLELKLTQLDKNIGKIVRKWAKGEII